LTTPANDAFKAAEESNVESLPIFGDEAIAETPTDIVRGLR
jgi:hypothetical protein